MIRNVRSKRRKRRRAVKERTVNFGGGELQNQQEGKGRLLNLELGGEDQVEVEKEELKKKKKEQQQGQQGRQGAAVCCDWSVRNSHLCGIKEEASQSPFAPPFTLTFQFLQVSPLLC